MIGVYKKLKRYYWEVSNLLPCNPKIKQTLMEEIKENIDQFLEEYPDADYDVIVQRFGTPQQIAASYLEEMDPQEVLKRLNSRERIAGIVTAGIALCVLLCGIWVLLFAADVMKSVDSYLEVYVYR